MTTFLAALVVFVLAMVAMAVGIILSNRRIRGTCGGLSNMTDSRGRSICDACQAPSDDCRGVEDGERRSASRETESNSV